MKRKAAFIFPGQGAQYIGMGKDFFEGTREARSTFEEANDILSYSITDLIFSGSEEELMLTKNAQPAIFVTSVAIMRAVQARMPDLTPVCASGLSLGEYSALYAAQKISFKECLELVRWRGSFMHEASVRHPGTMLAVLGLSEEEIASAGFFIANVNTPGQIVIAGTLEDMARAREVLSLREGVRVIPLKVAGAFHSPLMGYAKERLLPMIEKTSIEKSPIDLVMNVVGTVVEEVGEMKKNLTDQVVSTTRWVECVKTLMQKTDTFIEFGPSQVSGMVRKIGVPKEKLHSISTLRELEEMYDTISR
ncbi:MAG: hypothetical protein A3F09_03040 [Chlamydiae bacterium RIFCSPHIGHO2_12_FULL_49_11]|nr:MAG: hypothetical protein A3F09_03040 [Chlamydiae bacterium RIFCSPHIGHO2_12_FULL_49_11]